MVEVEVHAVWPFYQKVVFLGGLSKVPLALLALVHIEFSTSELVWSPVRPKLVSSKGAAPVVSQHSIDARTLN